MQTRGERKRQGKGKEGNSRERKGREGKRRKKTTTTKKSAQLMDRIPPALCSSRDSTPRETSIDGPKCTSAGILSRKYFFVQIPQAMDAHDSLFSFQWLIRAIFTFFLRKSINVQGLQEAVRYGDSQ